MRSNSSNKLWPMPAHTLIPAALNATINKKHILPPPPDPDRNRPKTHDFQKQMRVSGPSPGPPGWEKSNMKSVRKYSWDIN